MQAKDVGTHAPLVLATVLYFVDQTEPVAKGNLLMLLSVLTLVVGGDITVVP